MALRHRRGDRRAWRRDVALGLALLAAFASAAFNSGVPRQRRAFVGKQKHDGRERQRDKEAKTSREKPRSSAQGFLVRRYLGSAQARGGADKQNAGQRLTNGVCPAVAEDDSQTQTCVCDGWWRAGTPLHHRAFGRSNFARIGSW
jgi:hypothetical protein